MIADKIILQLPLWDISKCLISIELKGQCCLWSLWGSTPFCSLSDPSLWGFSKLCYRFALLSFFKLLFCVYFYLFFCPCSSSALYPLAFKIFLCLLLLSWLFLFFRVFFSFVTYLLLFNFSVSFLPSLLSFRCFKGSPEHTAISGVYFVPLWVCQDISGGHPFSSEQFLCPLLFLICLLWVSRYLCALHGHPFDLQQALHLSWNLELSLDLLVILGAVVSCLNEKCPIPVTDSTIHQVARGMVLHRAIFICQSIGEIKSLNHTQHWDCLCPQPGLQSIINWALCSVNNLHSEWQFPST